jgi:hypothetical protein
MKLVRTYPLLTSGHKVKGQKPLVQLDMGIFKNGSHSYRKRLAASVALVKPRSVAFALKLGDLLRFATVRTNRAIRPAKFFKVLSGGFFLGENWLGEVCVHGPELL